jgi:hypothetical protein
MYLTYELYLTNFGTTPLTLRHIEVVDASASASAPIAVFEAGELNTLLQRIGDPIMGDQIPAADDDSRRQLAAGVGVVVYLSIALERGAHVPDRLLHRLLTADAAVEGAVIGTHHTQLHVLGPPVEGANWQASGGPSNDSHHRRGVFVSEGRAVTSRRYAIDWLQIEHGSRFSGDARDKRSYPAYGKPVFAVADSTVATAKDGLPDNVPGHNENFHPAVPITIDTLGGNSITLDLGGGQFAYYFHLQPGSLRVKAGDHVRRGQLLARIGDSGDAREPHLHFEVTTSSTLMAGEGVPYLIDHYRMKLADNTWETRTHELPLKDMEIDFGEGRAKLNGGSGAKRQGQRSTLNTPIFNP